MRTNFNTDDGIQGRLNDKNILSVLKNLHPYDLNEWSDLKFY